MKTFRGTVVKIIDSKTVKVRVDRIWVHPVYKKRAKRSKNYLVHMTGKAPLLQAKVSFKECRPISKNKKWMLMEDKKLKIKNKKLKS